MNKLFRLIYRKLFLIDDTPHRIALGFSLGVFTGLMPGIGPLAALFLAVVLRVNRAAAVLGSLITNTWMSIVIFLLSFKIGSAIMGVDWQTAHDRYLAFVKNFHWAGLFQISALDIIFPLALGYVVISLLAGCVAYLIIVTAILLRRWK